MDGDIMIKKYPHDSPELISRIGFLMGSDEWQTEHKQALRRQSGKMFYLLVEKDLISMCSVYKNQILDCHTIKQHRNQGYMQKLIRYVLDDNTGRIYSGTANPSMENIFKKLGFEYTLNRGRYRYYAIY